MECLSYCIAKNIDLTKLDNYFKSNIISSEIIKFSSMKLRDVLKLSTNDKENAILFVFKNGTVVSWGIKRHQISKYLSIIKLFADKIILFLVCDELSYQVGEKTSIEPHDYFEVDCLTIEEENDELMLSLSYGFAQSVKLQYFETIIETLIEKNSPIIQHLSNTGKMPVTRNKIRQIIGELLGCKSEMNLISNFLYHPKYFWQHPTLEAHYAMLERYLHIQRRVNAINHQLDTLNEIFVMFNAYLENRHAHSLEIIIIILIAIEILFAVINFHF